MKRRKTSFSLCTIRETALGRRLRREFGRKQRKRPETTHRMRRGSRRLRMWDYEYSFIFRAQRKALSAVENQPRRAPPAKPQLLSHAEICIQMSQFRHHEVGRELPELVCLIMTHPPDRELHPSRISLRALEAGNFFVADVQTGLGPFVAAYLVASHWSPSSALYMLTIAGLMTVLLQTPAGAIVDQVRPKRMIVVAGSLALALGALLLWWKTERIAVLTAQLLIGGAAPFLGPALAAITMGLVGRNAFDAQFGRNQSCNAAGNVAAALLALGVSYYLGDRDIFLAAACLVVPAIGFTLLIKPGEIDYELARGGCERVKPGRGQTLRMLAHDRVLLLFLVCCFFFHLANAAMLPELGELLSRQNARTAVPFMTACVMVTQLVISFTAAWVGVLAQRHGRRPLLLLGFGVLPIRAVLYTVTHHAWALILIQCLDGVANTIFGVVAVLVIADRTRGTGRFNLASGALATAVGAGAALSNSYGGYLIHLSGFRVSFLGLGAIAFAAFLLLFFFLPETRAGKDLAPASLDPAVGEAV
jgi:MFS family permease